MAFEQVPVDIGAIYEGQRIRKGDFRVELGGKNAPCAELVLAKGEDDDRVDVASLEEEADQVLSFFEDGEDEATDGRDGGGFVDDRVKLIGPDLEEMELGETYPYGVLIEIAGDDVNKDLESVVERRHHEFTNYIDGTMHLNQRDAIWIRVNKDSVDEGMDSLRYIGKSLIDLFKVEMPYIEEMQVTLITDENAIEDFVDTSQGIYTARDERARSLHEEDVDSFYGCNLCQSFAPDHVCAITPDRISLCGSINYFDAKAAAQVDPDGPYFEIPKGENVDEEKGEWTGINDKVEERSGGVHDRFWLHTVFQNIHTSCGCFEALAVYLPDVDGLMIVDRDYNGETPYGVPFSTLAGQAGGGKQVDGVLGIAIEYMRSPKFLQADGGMERVVWMPEDIKDQVAESIPEDLQDKIVTDESTSDINELKDELEDRGHPVTDRWFEVTDDLVKQAVQHIKSEGGQVKPKKAADELGITKDQFMELVQEMKEREILA